LSQGDDPIIYALALKESQMEEYAASDGKYLGVVNQLGTPFLVSGP
jgi:hypothetical protein